MKTIFTFLFGLIFSATLFSQPAWQWGYEGGGAGNDNGTGISTDVNGYSYVVGNFFDTAHFGTQSSISHGLRDIFIAKYSPAGNCIWSTHCGSIHDDDGSAIAIDGNGNCYITGGLMGMGIFGTTTVGDTGDLSNFFLAKYDSNGNFLWVRSHSDTFNVWGNSCNSVAVDHNGNAWITGNLGTGLHTFGAFTLNGPGAYVIKYGPNGNVIYATNLGMHHNAANGFSCSDIDIDTAGNAYICGSISGHDTINSQPFASNPGGTDGVIVKLDAAGNFVWLKQSHALLAGGNASMNSIGFDHQSHIYVLATIISSSVFGSDTLYDSDNTFGNCWEAGLIKYDLDGNEIWARQTTHTSNAISYCISLACDATSNGIYFTGMYSSNLIFGNVALSDPGNMDTFIAKYDSTGTCNFAIGSTGQACDAYGFGISTDGYDGVYIVGQDKEPVTFGNYVTQFIGGEDMFIAKIEDWGLESIKDENVNEEILFFASQDAFHLTLKNPEIVRANSVLKIYDMTGRVIKQIAITDIEMNIDKSGIVPGIYTWQIENTQQRFASGKISTF